MKITYNGHACFTVESEGYRVVLDPYKGVRGYEDVKLEAEEVLCSHGHFDHAYTEGVTLREGKESPFKESFIECFHDDKGGELRGKNRITVLSAEGKKVAHFGDLGHLLGLEHTDELKDLDCALVPVGGYYTIDALQAAALIRELKPGKIVPMHYRDGERGLEVVGTTEEFISLLNDEEKKRLLLVKGYGETAEI